MSGMMSITGHADGEAGGGPMKVGVAVTDLFTGMYATTAILMALEARHKTGRGQHIDLALLDVAMAMLANQGAGFLNAGNVPQRMGNIHPSVVPYQDFPTADGNMLLAVGNDGQFARFCQAAGLDWAQDERFTANAGRVIHRKTLIPMVAQVTRGKTTAEWIALLEAHNVPCGPINHVGQAFADPQVLARHTRVEQLRYPEGTPLEVGQIQRIASTASPLRLSETPPSLRYAPPALGQHTHEVMRDYLQLDPARIAELQGKGVI